MGFSRAWFLAGLFFVTLVTLCIEILFTRLLSVTLWYHLSFFAVSTAMFGMSAGALQVYLSGRAFEGAATMRLMHRLGVGFALCVPVSHLVLLLIPMPVKADVLDTQALAGIVVMTIAVAVPFFLSGMLVTTALTLVPGRIGLTYAVDLVGAALGTLLVFPLLEGSNISTAFFLCGALGALGALCFLVAGGMRPSWTTLLAALVLGWIGFANKGAEDPLRVWFPKGNSFPGVDTEEFWNVHAEVTLMRTPTKGPQFWGPGKGALRYDAKILNMAIDGAAGTVITEWDGRRESLAWAEHDVTSLPYHVRPGGNAAIIGVGGGRDVLTALRFESKSVVGIEINSILLDLQQELVGFARLADDPRVTLVHDEARSYLTRSGPRFDVLQMSLIDTWASTGAGAMTLTENGLYTLEAWDVFLDTLAPGGIFGVSRWYDPASVSETNRMVALGVAALLERGVAEPARHMALVACGTVATLITGIEPLAEVDLARMRAAAERFEFEVVFAPGQPAGDPQLAAIAAATSRAALTEACAHEHFDYTPPTDERPFFFNLLKLRGALAGAGTSDSQGVVGGNLRATGTLAVLFCVSLLLVVAVILLPLLSAGLPRVSASSFALSLFYFVAIGLGFMLVQIPCMQRFSVYLGHPVYALVVLLFSMISAAGLGSFVSDRLDIEHRVRLTRVVPLVIALAILLLSFAIQPVIDLTIGWGAFARALMVVSLIAPVAFLLGFGFPMGMRLVGRVAPDALPWMWGINGAASVFAAVLSIVVSMALGIHANLYAAVLLYGTLALVAPRLWARGARAPVS